jgi:hypothetical protein
VAQDDAGVYTCLAHNDGGQVLCKAELMVHGGELVDPSQALGRLQVSTWHPLSPLWHLDSWVPRGSHKPRTSNETSGHSGTREVTSVHIVYFLCFDSRGQEARLRKTKLSEEAAFLL